MHCQVMLPESSITVWHVEPNFASDSARCVDKHTGYILPSNSSCFAPTQAFLVRQQPSHSSRSVTSTPAHMASPLQRAVMSMVQLTAMLQSLQPVLIAKSVVQVLRHGWQCSHSPSLPCPSLSSPLSSLSDHSPNRRCLWKMQHSAPRDRIPDQHACMLLSLRSINTANIMRCWMSTRMP